MHKILGLSCRHFVSSRILRETASLGIRIGDSLRNMLGGTSSPHIFKSDESIPSRRTKNQEGRGAGDDVSICDPRLPLHKTKKELVVKRRTMRGSRERDRRRKRRGCEARETDKRPRMRERERERYSWWDFWRVCVDEYNLECTCVCTECLGVSECANMRLLYMYVCVGMNIYVPSFT